MELRPFIRILVYIIVKQGTSEENISEKDSYRHPKVSWTCCSMLTFITELMPILLSSLLYLLDAGSKQTTMISVLYYMSFWTLWKYNIIYLLILSHYFLHFQIRWEREHFGCTTTQVLGAEGHSRSSPGAVPAFRELHRPSTPKKGYVQDC